MKKILSFIISISVGAACYGQQWSYQAGGYGLGGSLQGIYQAPSGTLFLQSSPMMRSADAGATWQYVSHPGDVFTSSKPSFINATEGWSAGAKVDMYTPPSGPFGTPYIPQVLATTDGGKTWNLLPVSGLEGLNVPRFIHFFDRNVGIIAGETLDFELLVFKTNDGGKTWNRRLFSSELFSIVDGQFLTSSIGYLSSSNGMIKSTDAGETWHMLTSPADPAKNQTISRQSFTSVTDGWVAGSGNLLARTTDGGLTWTPVASGLDAGGSSSSVYITGLKFFDATHGYISSMYGKLLYTDNAGATWQERTPEGVDFSYAQDIAFMGTVADIVFITGGDGILTSSDGGIHWQKKLDPFIWESGLFDITFSNDNSGWAVGYSGALLQTTDGGASWNVANTPAWENESQSWHDLKSLAVQDETKIWAVGGRGNVLHTTNGVDWTAQTVGEKDLHDVFFLKGTDKGWIVGDGNTLLHYTGTTWVPQVEAAANAPALTAIFFLDEDHGWAVGERGTILKTTNGGATWTPKNSGILRQLNDVYFADEHVGYAVGNNDYILKTTDGGESWRYQVIPHAFVGHMTGVYFATPHRGWIVGSDETRGAIYSTTDGGYTWHRAPVFGASMLSVYFQDMNRGWATDSNGKIYRYSDNATGEGDQTITPPIMNFEAVADTLYNFSASQFALIDSTNNSIPFLGKNGSGHEEFGEKYTTDGETWVAGIIVYHHGRSKNGNNVGEYNVFSVNDQGYPDRKIGRKDVYFKDIDLSSHAMEVRFSEPVPVDGSFFVTFNLTDYYHGGFDGDDIGIMHTSNNTRPQADDRARNVVRVHDHSDRVWRPISEAYQTAGYYGHLGIFPIIYRKDQVTGIEAPSHTSGLQLLTAYPNPAIHEASIAYSLQKPASTSVAIYDMRGKKVMHTEPALKEAGHHVETFDVRTLPTGLYIYKIHSGNASQTSKLVIVR
ncbi:T9SS type A sorting domain-containing protein [Dawidia soli]|uniref:T9SS type A sorting domain-containing protein n=1 Tax=Dawidia soli TaxID=2782352 RepID=A0AAP2GJM0_9BACT|nr:YCF48-related protein [Dawidia soli]MBT1688118.1 T9SS type A sorting domain-containing protein [Dawidia soli]